MIDLLKDNEFSFWVPMTIVKSSQEKDKKGKKRRWLQGIASTKDRDLQHETVEQRGIDFTYFLEHGYFNNDHKPGFLNKVGQPTECKVVEEGLWVKGFLFDNHKVADEIWQLALAIEASDSDRKLGFSIQGKVLRRAGRKILKCWIQDIAITAAPINTNTWLDVVKSLSNVPQDMWVCDSHGCYIDTPPVDKSLSEEEMDIKKDKDQREEEEKALSATSPEGRALTPESLEEDLTDLDHGGGDKPRRHHDDKRTNKSLTFNQCVELLCEHRGLSTTDANVVAQTVFEMNGIPI